MAGKIGWESARRAVEKEFGLPTADTGLGTAKVYVVPVILTERHFNDAVVFVDRETGDVTVGDRRSIPKGARHVP
jgi:hypothetical protein